MNDEKYTFGDRNKWTAQEKSEAEAIRKKNDLLITGASLAVGIWIAKKFQDIRAKKAQDVVR